MVICRYKPFQNESTIWKKHASNKISQNHQDIHQIVRNGTYPESLLLRDSFNWKLANSMEIWEADLTFHDNLDTFGSSKIPWEQRRGALSLVNLDHTFVDVPISEHIMFPIFLDYGIFCNLSSNPFETLFLAVTECETHG